jgi:hypothetical protein
MNEAIIKPAAETSEWVTADAPPAARLAPLDADETIYIPACGVLSDAFWWAGRARRDGSNSKREKTR